MPIKSVTTTYRFFMVLIIALLLVIATYFLYQYWPKIILQSTSWQRDLHRILSSCLRQIKQNSMEAGSTLLIVSFFYGLIHAAGPGHGKVVIATYIATHRQRLKKSLLLTLSASILQAMVAILLVSIVLGLLKLSTKYLHLSAFWFEKISFLLIAIFGATMIFRAVKNLMAMRKLKNKSIQIKQVGVIYNPSKVGVAINTNAGHDDNCQCCGYKHTLSDQELQKSWSSLLLVVITMGIRPCSGAIFILLFASLLNVYGWGILATFAMSIGTAITISLIAILVHIARQKAFNLSNKLSINHYFAPLLLLLGGMLLLLVGIIMYQSLGDSSQLFFQR